MWNIEYTYIEKWLDTLDDVAISMIFAALERLQEEGPNLGRPLVDTLSNTEVKNLTIHRKSCDQSLLKVQRLGSFLRSTLNVVQLCSWEGTRQKVRITRLNGLSSTKETFQKRRKFLEIICLRLEKTMADLNKYLNKRGITDEEMNKARLETQAVIDSFNLKEARRVSNMTQVQVARAIGVSQNRVSRMENGDMNAMSIDSLRRYVSALGGNLTLVANLPSGRVTLV